MGIEKKDNIVLGHSGCPSDCLYCELNRMFGGLRERGYYNEPIEYEKDTPIKWSGILEPEKFPEATPISKFKLKRLIKQWMRGRGKNIIVPLNYSIKEEEDLMMRLWHKAEKAAKKEYCKICGDQNNNEFLHFHKEIEIWNDVGSWRGNAKRRLGQLVGVTIDEKKLWHPIDYEKDTPNKWSDIMEMNNPTNEEWLIAVKERIMKKWREAEKPKRSISMWYRKEREIKRLNDVVIWDLNAELIKQNIRIKEITEDANKNRDNLCSVMKRKDETISKLEKTIEDLTPIPLFEYTITTSKPKQIKIEGHFHGCIDPEHIEITRRGVGTVCFSECISWTRKIVTG